MGNCKVMNIFARCKHQGAHNTADLSIDTSQATQPRASQHIDKEGFDRVVDMVSNGDNRVTVFITKRLKPGISQTASSHLHRFTRACHLTHSIEMGIIKLNTKTLSLTLNHHLILVALLATQLKVAMCNTELIACSRCKRH